MTGELAVKTQAFMASALDHRQHLSQCFRLGREQQSRQYGRRWMISVSLGTAPHLA